MNARLQFKLLKPSPIARAPIGAAALENAARAAYQSARCQNGYRAPLPLTLAEALAEADAYARKQYAAEQAPIDPITDYDARRGI